MVNRTGHVKANITIMVWGAIWIGGRSELQFIVRDQRGFSTNSYLWALEDGLLPVYEPGRIFQQDNAKIHVSYQAREWFENHGIYVIDWPAHSPDMNPIEHVWKAMKAVLHRNHPNIHLLKDNRADIAQLKGWIREAWHEVPQSLVDHLIRSIPRRILALQRAKEWYTKY